MARTDSISPKVQVMAGYDYVTSAGDELDEHLGKWIIVHNGKLVASDEDLIKIYNRFKKEHPREYPFVMNLAKESEFLL